MIYSSEAEKRKTTKIFLMIKLSFDQAGAQSC